jgi:hypothetical protein
MGAFITADTDEARQKAGNALTCYQVHPLLLYGRYYHAQNHTGAFITTMGFDVERSHYTCILELAGLATVTGDVSTVHSVGCRRFGSTFEFEDISKSYGKSSSLRCPLTKPYRQKQ